MKHQKCYQYGSERNEVAHIALQQLLAQLQEFDGANLYIDISMNKPLNYDGATEDFEVSHVLHTEVIDDDGGHFIECATHRVEVWKDEQLVLACGETENPTALQQYVADLLG